MASESAIDRDELRAAVSELLDKESGSAAVRAVIDPPDDEARDRLWSQLAAVGWTGIEIPAALGGAGASFGDLAVVLIALGAHLDPSPVFSTAVLGTGALLMAGSPAQREEWLPRLADASARSTAAVPPLGGRAYAQAEVRADALVLDGSWHHVLDAKGADVLALHAISADGDVLVLVPRDAPGISTSRVEMHDPTRRAYSVRADRVRLPLSSVMSSGADATRAIGLLRDRAALAISCDSLGIADRVVAITTEYARQRVQFDRPIGSFQAVKHQCTDMFIGLETSRAIVLEAVRAADAAEPEVPLLVSMAKAYAGDAAADIASEGISLHGGIGYTWEHDMHFYLKRAMLNQALYGSSRSHRRRVADVTLGSPAHSAPS